MFRSDRDALAGKVDDLRTDNERLRAENEAMRQDLLARRAADPAYTPRGNLYRGGHISDGERAALSSHQLESYPVWATVLWHVLTFGIASFFRFNAMHDRLPKAEHDDPSTIKSVLLHFVPYFNLYWIFFNGLRLADRVNLQLRARGEAPMIERSTVITAGVLSVIPYVNFLASPVGWLFVAISMQRAVNRIVEIDAMHGVVEPPAARVRIPAVGELAGPDDVAAHVQAEEEAAAGEEARRRVV